MMANSMDIDLLRKLIDYDPDTGILTFKERSLEYFKDCKYPLRTHGVWNKRFAGKEAGSITFSNKKSYKTIHVMVLGSTYLAHRLAWAIYYGEWPTDQIDHANGDATDNRICNLSVVSQSTNAKNKCIQSSNTSGYTGVYRERNKWRAVITVNSKHIQLGNYDDIMDAITARKEAEIKYGFHENHGRENPNAKD
jgi:hypothetical protein